MLNVLSACKIHTVHLFLCYSQTGTSENASFVACDQIPRMCSRSENSKDHRSVQNCVAAPSTDFTANFESTYYTRPSFSTFQSACSLSSNAWAPQYVEWSTMCHFCTRRGSTKQRYWDKNTSFYKWSVYCCDIIGFKSTAGIGTLRCLPCFNTSVVETSRLDSVKGCVCVCSVQAFKVSNGTFRGCSDTIWHMLWKFCAWLYLLF